MAKISRVEKTGNVTIEGDWNGEDVKIRGQRVTGKTMLELGLIVEGQAALLAPVDIGRLRGSIHTKQFGGAGSKPEKPEDEIEAPSEKYEVFVGTALEYAPYVEFGTVRSNAQPFLRPALDLARGRTLTVTKKNARYEFGDYLK